MAEQSGGDARLSEKIIIFFAYSNIGLLLVATLKEINGLELTL